MRGWVAWAVDGKISQSKYGWFIAMIATTVLLYCAPMFGAYLYLFLVNCWIQARLLRAKLLACDLWSLPAWLHVLVFSGWVSATVIICIGIWYEEVLMMNLFVLLGYVLLTITEGLTEAGAIGKVNRDAAQLK